MGLSKSVLLLLLATVFYTDTVGVYSTPSKNQNVEDFSTIESATKLKHPLGNVCSKISTTISSSYSNASSGEKLGITRHLTGAKHGTSSSLKISNGNNTSLHENTIGQASSQAHKATIGEIDEKGEIRLQHFKGTSENDTKEMELKHSQDSSQTSGENISRKQVEDGSRKQKEETVLPDARIRQFKDQLVRANIYLSLSGTRSNSQFIRELRVRVRDVLRVLGDTTKDSELPDNASEKLKANEKTLQKGKQIQDDCAAVVKKLRAMLHLTEEQIKIKKKQTLFLTHLTSKTVPKGLHCLPLRLSDDYFKLNLAQQHFQNKEKLSDPKLYHYSLFSDNVLAAAVVVNSTLTHVTDPSKHVFHIVTDRLNYAAMRMWFLAYPPGKATIEVQNVEDFKWLNSSYSPVLSQQGSSSVIDYFFKSHRAEFDPNLKYRNPKYLSILNYLRFYLPKIFPKLEKVLFLDEDIVAQKDLTSLWSLDLKGKVIGVVETCGKNFHRFDRYLNFSNPLISKNFSPHACGWAFGMNIVNLNNWREQNITEVYHKWQNLNHDRLLWKLGTLPAGLITFWNHTYTLDESWHVLGLGYNPKVPQRDIEQAAVIHYNGNLKPWLEIAIPKFRSYWAKYLDYDYLYLRECNITP